MFDKARLSAARALLALVVAMSLGLGLLIAVLAASLGVLLVAALRIVVIGPDRKAHSASVDTVPTWLAEPDPDTQPA